ncbi:MAG: hypothetical protein QE278_06395 [Limnobacter sp.]|nr:hypothetical protein [Limnobacter sp.]
MLINHYLNIKAYHTAETVLRRLESKGSQANRDSYIQALREYNEGEPITQAKIKGNDMD